MSCDALLEQIIESELSGTPMPLPGFVLIRNYSEDNILLYVLYAYAKKGFFVNSEYVLSTLNPKIEELMFKTKPEILKISKGCMDALEYPAELLCLFKVLYSGCGNCVGRIKNFMEIYYTLPNIIHVLKKYNSLSLRRYAKNIPSTLPGYLEFCEANGYTENITVEILNVGKTHDEFIKILSHCMNQINSARDMRIILPVFNDLIKAPNEKLYNFIQTNIEIPSIYALAYQADNLIYSQLINSSKVTIDKAMCIMDGELCPDRLMRLIDAGQFEVSNIKLHLRGNKYNNLVLKMLDNNILGLALSADIIVNYFNFRLSDRNTIRIITDYLMRQYPDNVFKLSVGSKGYLYFCEYEGPIFIIKTNGKLKHGFKYYMESTPGEDVNKYYELVAAGQIIVNSSKLIYDDPEYLASLMNNRETFLRYKQTIIACSSYDSVSCRRMKSASNIH